MQEEGVGVYKKDFQIVENMEEVGFDSAQLSHGLAPGLTAIHHSPPSKST